MQVGGKEKKLAKFEGLVLVLCTYLGGLVVVDGDGSASGGAVRAVTTTTRSGDTFKQA